LNHAGDANEDDLIELIELDAGERFDISTSFPLVQAQNVELELEENSNSNGDNDDDGVQDDEEHLVDLSSALSLIESADDECKDETSDHLHLLNYHNSSRSSYTETDVNVDAVSLLMPELGNATDCVLDCGNYVDYDEFNMCLNNILSEKDNEVELVDVAGNDGSKLDSNVNSGKNQNRQQHHQQHQQWHVSDVSDVLSIVPLNNNLGLSFQEFATESNVTTDDSSASSSSSQLA